MGWRLRFTSVLWGKSLFSQAQLKTRHLDTSSFSSRDCLNDHVIHQTHSLSLDIIRFSNSSNKQK